MCRRRRVGLGIGTDGDALYSSSCSTEHRQTVSAPPTIVRARVGILSCDSVSSSLLPSVAEPRNRPHRHRNYHHHRYRHLHRPSPAIAHPRHARHSPASPSIVYSRPPARPPSPLTFTHPTIYRLSFFSPPPCTALVSFPPPLAPFLNPATPFPPSSPHLPLPARATPSCPTRLSNVRSTNKITFTRCNCFGLR